MIRYISQIFNHISRLIDSNAVHVKLELFKLLKNDYSIKLTFKANDHKDEYYFYMVDDEFHRSESVEKAQDELLLCVDNSSLECKTPTYLTVNHTQEGLTQVCNFLLEKHFAYA